MNLDELTVLSEKIDKLQKSIDQIDADLAKDREDLQEFRIRLGAVEERVKVFGKIQIRETDIMQDKVAEAVQPVINEAHELKKTIDKKKSIAIEKIKKHWWKFWRR